MTGTSRCQLAVLAGLLFVAVLGAQHATAHFKLNLNVRIFHVVHSDGATDIYLRTPMSYLVAGLVGPTGADGLPAPAPFTVNRLENGQLMHLVDGDRMRADPAGLGRLAAITLVVSANGQPLKGEVVQVRAHRIGAEPGFATKSEAQAAFTDGSVFLTEAGETYVGDTVVDIHLRYPAVAGDQPIALSSQSDPGLPAQEDTANLILDYRGDTPRTYRATGLMREPVEVSGSAAAAASTFIISGVWHILEGLDHVLFVICLIIGASSLRALVGRITGFTLGHTVTLIAGFFGFAPAGNWFIPTIETLIALSIIYAAAIAVFKKSDGGSGAAMFFVTAGIGLLHGFGFSFMLHEILRVDAENVWQSLLAFNIGVEIGQLAIVALTWPLVLLFRGAPAPTWRVVQSGVAASSAAIALVWVVQRAPLIV